MPIKCKKAAAAYMKQYRTDNKEELEEKARQYKRDNREAVSVYQREYYRDNKERVDVLNRDAALKRLYGLTEADYDSILETQDGCCPICLKHHTEFDRRLAVDHIHDRIGDVDYNKGVAAAVRGLLCNQCNQAIGKLGDSMDNFIRLIAYKMDNDLCQFTLIKKETNEED